jgi:hypothetical protein
MLEDPSISSYSLECQARSIGSADAEQ